MCGLTQVAALRLNKLSGPLPSCTCSKLQLSAHVRWRPRVLMIHRQWRPSAPGISAHRSPRNRRKLNREGSAVGSTRLRPSSRLAESVSFVNRALEERFTSCPPAHRLPFAVKQMRSTTLRKTDRSFLSSIWHAHPNSEERGRWCTPLEDRKSPPWHLRHR